MVGYFDHLPANTLILTHEEWANVVNYARRECHGNLLQALRTFNGEINSKYGKIDSAPLKIFELMFAKGNFQFDEKKTLYDVFKDTFFRAYTDASIVAKMDHYIRTRQELVFLSNLKP